MPQPFSWRPLSPRVSSSAFLTSKTNPKFANLPVYLALITLVFYDTLVFLPTTLKAFRGKSGITPAPLHVAQEAGLTNAIVFIPDVEHWYDFAVFSAATSPTLDSDVVYAIYGNEPQAQAVRALYPDRGCCLQRQTQLVPCPF